MDEQRDKSLPEGWTLGCMNDGRIDHMKSTSWLHPVTKTPFRTGFFPYNGSHLGWETGISEAGQRYYIKYCINFAHFTKVFLISHLDQITSWVPPIAKRKIESKTEPISQATELIYVNLEAICPKTPDKKERVLENITSHNLESEVSKSEFNSSMNEGTTISPTIQQPTESQKGTGKKLASSLAKLFRGTNQSIGRTPSKGRNHTSEPPSDITLLPQQDNSTYIIGHTNREILNPMNYGIISPTSRIVNGYDDDDASGLYAIDGQGESMDKSKHSGWLFFLENRPVTHWVKQWATLEDFKLTIYKTCPLDPRAGPGPLSTVRFISTLRHSRDFQGFVTHQEFSIKIPGPSLGASSPGTLATNGHAGTPSTPHHPTLYSFALEIRIYHVICGGHLDKLTTTRTATKVESITMATAASRDRDAWVRTLSHVISHARLNSTRGEECNGSSGQVPAKGPREMKNAGQPGFRDRAKTEINMRPNKLTVNRVLDPSKADFTQKPISPTKGGARRGERLVEGHVTTPPKSRDAWLPPSSGGKGSPLRDDLVLLLIRNRRELKRLQAQMMGQDYNARPNASSRVARYERAIKTLETLLYQTDTGGHLESPSVSTSPSACINTPENAVPGFRARPGTNNWDDLAAPICYDSDFTSPALSLAFKENSLRKRFENLVESATRLTIDRDTFEKEVQSLNSQLDSLNLSRPDRPPDRVETERSSRYYTDLTILSDELNRFARKARLFYRTQEGLKLTFTQQTASCLSTASRWPGEKRGDYLSEDKGRRSESLAKPQNFAGGRPSPPMGQVILRGHGRRDPQVIALRVKRSLSLPPQPDEPLCDYLERPVEKIASYKYFGDYVDPATMPVKSRIKQEVSIQRGPSVAGHKLFYTPKIVKKKQAPILTTKYNGSSSFDSHYPDLVRSSVFSGRTPPSPATAHKGDDFSLNTIDQELCKPDKICIPLRLGQCNPSGGDDTSTNDGSSSILEQSVETEEERAQKSLKKAYLRNLLSNYNMQDMMYEHVPSSDHRNPSLDSPPFHFGVYDKHGFPDTGTGCEEEKRFRESCREERLRRQRLLSLNEMLAREVVAKSKLMMAKSNVKEGAMNKF